MTEKNQAKTKIVWKNLVTILKNELTEGGKLRYVKEVIEGVRNDIPIFPVIVLEPVSETDEQHTLSNNRRIKLTVNITCWTEVIDINTQITGEDIIPDETPEPETPEGGEPEPEPEPEEPVKKGIFDLVADVKNVISSNPNLNGSCLLQRFVSTDYSFENYPYRAGNIRMEFEFIAWNNERTEEVK